MSSDIALCLARDEPTNGAVYAPMSLALGICLLAGGALLSKPRLLQRDQPIVPEIVRMVQDLERSDVSILLVEQNARAALQIAACGCILETRCVALPVPAYKLEHDTRVAETYLGLGQG